jgi:hypothetical protein
MCQSLLFDAARKSKSIVGPVPNEDYARCNTGKNIMRQSAGLTPIPRPANVYCSVSKAIR